MGPLGRLSGWSITFSIPTRRAKLPTSPCLQMSETALRDRIDDYVSSIHAIVGFANFYLWDASTRQDRDDVIVFQARRLRPVPPTPSPETANADDPPNPNEDSPDS